MKKSNPQGEWLKGFAIAKRLNIEDFVIPLNTEGLPPDEITWNLQPVNYIPFAPSWAEGLAYLLKKLASLDAPRVLSHGPQLAIESIVARSAVQDEGEVLLSNCFEFEQIPPIIRKYQLRQGRLSMDERRALRVTWGCRDVSSMRVLAFHDPPSSVTRHHEFDCVGEVFWQSSDRVEGINTQDLVVSLIHRCLESLLEAKGMRCTRFEGRPSQWYLPQGVLDNDRVSVTFPSGKKSWFKGVGERTYFTTGGRETYRYHLSPSFSVLRDRVDPVALFLRNRVYLTDADGKVLDRRQISSRRKHLCRTWFNREWCARTLGSAQLLADDDMRIRFGPVGRQQLVISAIPILVETSHRIRDELVDEPDEIYTMWHEEDETRFDDGPNE